MTATSTSSSKFSDYGLDEALVEACTSQGYETPTEVQQNVLAHLRNPRDTVIVSGTGTGKTAAYALPILHHLLSDDKYFYALVLVPTRELAHQVHEVFASLGCSIGLRTTVLIGGIDIVTQGKSLAARPHVVIGTPGRTYYHLSNTKGISHKSFRYIVIDECDKLLETDFEGELRSILDLLAHRKHFCLVTATQTQKVHKLKSKYLVDTLEIQSSTSDTLPTDLVQRYIFLPQKYKEVYLYDVLRRAGAEKTVVFVSTCLLAEKVHRLLLKLGEDTACIHGGKPQPERTATIESFRKGSRSILIATDVAARGMDVPRVRLVVNYDIPNCHKDYIHRVGRTSRAGASGTTVTFVSQYDIEDFKRLERKLGSEMEEYNISPKDIEDVSEMVQDAKKEAEAEIKDEKIGAQLKERKKGKKQETRGTRKEGSRKHRGNSAHKSR